MATLNLSADDLILARARAAYGVDTNLELKSAIISDIKNRVKTYEAEKVALTEQAKVKAAEEAKWLAVSTAEQQAQQDIIIS